MDNDIVMIFKTNDKYQDVEGLISFLESQSYKKDFTEFMKEMESKYGKLILRII